jgi:hypothetical protein
MALAWRPGPPSLEGNRTKEGIAPTFLAWRIAMNEFDLDGFYDGPDTLDDGFDHTDEYADGFHELDPEEEMADTAG